MMMTGPRSHQRKMTRSRSRLKKRRARRKSQPFLVESLARIRRQRQPNYLRGKLLAKGLNRKTVWWNVLLQRRLCNSALVVPRTRKSITRTCSWGGTSTSWSGPSIMWTPSQTTLSSTWVIHVLIITIIIICIPGSARGVRPSASSLWSAARAAGPGGGERQHRQHPAQQTGGTQEEIRPEVQLGREGSRKDQWGLEFTKGMMTDCCWDEFNWCVTLLQVTIEGFDPAKFKAANKTGAGDNASKTNLRSLNINTTQASTLR